MDEIARLAADAEAALKTLKEFVEQARVQRSGA